MLNGLDLFSGIGGLTIALSEWVTPVAYCENDKYAQAILLSRMEDGSLFPAPIWDDITTLRGSALPIIDIIYGGFPCQDISVAGRGKGLDGERSGLFFQIIRLVDEIRPTFIFLENVPAITTRGLGTVAAEITKLGYDCRWTTLSAAEVGANHKRERWWLLAYTSSIGRNNGSNNQQGRHLQEATIGEAEKIQQEGNKRIVGVSASCSILSDTGCEQQRADKVLRSESKESIGQNATELCGDVSNSNSERLEGQRQEPCGIGSQFNHACDESWWTTEPDVCRVANGIPNRVDRIRGLGNAVVPLQAKTAFKELMGL